MRGRRSTAWLHTLTPYGGGSGGGKKSAQYSGFYSLPEVGERVLVEFLGDWDSEAVVIGVIRQHPQGTAYNPKHTKRWSMPSGNEVIMNTQGGRDVFQVKTAGRMAFESQIADGRHSLTINSGGNPANAIHYEGMDGSTRLDISVATDIFMQAGSDITLAANSISLIAKGGGGIHLESLGDGIGIQSTVAGVTIQGQTGISLKAPAPHKVALEGGAGVVAHAKSGPLELRGGPDILVNVNPIPDVPDLPLSPQGVIEKSGA